MIIDKFENLPLYFSCLPRLDRAAEFLAGENIADGHYEIDGEKIFDNLFEFAGSFADADIAKLTQYLLTENRERMLYYPAALKLHRLGAARLAQGRERGIFKGRRHSIL